jgi:hypothetical protein
MILWAAFMIWEDISGFLGGCFAFARAFRLLCVFELMSTDCSLALFRMLCCL